MHSSDELIVEHALRKKIRGKILEAIETEKKKEKERLEEQALRKLVRQVISEATKQASSPHDSTGINTLEDLLKSIIPTLEADYKRLTTSTDQRQSFRAHIINAVENSLAPIDANSENPRTGREDVNTGEESPEPMGEPVEKPASFSPDNSPAPKVDPVPEEEPLAENQEIYLQEEEPADQNKFIDINGKPEAEEKEEPKDPRDEFGMDGFEVTGRNFAYSTYKKIDTQVKDAYALLASPEDKEIFFDYLITNLKLYFDRFEEELSPQVNEPTTPEYEAQVDKSLEQPMMESLSENILEKIIQHIERRI